MFTPISERKKKTFAPKRKQKYSVVVIYVLVYIVFRMLLKNIIFKKAISTFSIYNMGISVLTA